MRRLQAHSGTLTVHRRFQSLAFALLITLSAGYAHGATRIDCIELGPDFYMSCQLVLDGPITREDPVQFSELLRSGGLWEKRAGERSGPFYRLVLNSPGGDVDAALSLGFLLQQHAMPVVVREKDLCASSCAVVLASAPKRKVSGRVAVHRIFTLRTQDSAMSVANYFEKTGVRARAQFQRAGVKPEFWDFMLSIPAEEPRLLSADERRDFRLEGVSPAYSDFEDSREANKLGVSKGEYLARKAAFNSCFNWVMTTNPAGDNWWERCRVRAKLPAD